MDEQNTLENYLRNLGNSLADGLIESSDFYRPRLGYSPISKVFLYGSSVENMLAVSSFMQERLEEKYTDELNREVNKNSSSTLERLFDLNNNVEIILGSSFELPKDAGDNSSFSEYPINLAHYFDEKGLPARVRSPDGKLTLRNL